jgi:hypothetical protein
MRVRTPEHDAIDKLPVLGTRQYLIKSHVPGKDFAAVKNYLLAPHAHVPLLYLSNHIAVSYNTVKKWQEELKKNPNYDPKYTLTNRAMSDRLEDCLMSFIEDEFLTNGYYFNNGMLTIIAPKFLELAPEEDKLKEVFKASDTWCKEFRERHKYVWRKAHLSRCPSNSEDLVQRSEEFTVKIREVIEKHKANDTLFLVANMDETSWKIAYPGVFTWAKRGAKKVKVRINYNQKQNVTAIATITADPELKKLPLTVIASGKTKECEKKLGSHPDYSYNVLCCNILYFSL